MSFMEPAEGRQASISANIKACTSRLLKSVKHRADRAKNALVHCVAMDYAKESNTLTRSHAPLLKIEIKQRVAVWLVHLSGRENTNTIICNADRMTSSISPLTCPQKSLRQGCAMASVTDILHTRSITGSSPHLSRLPVVGVELQHAVEQVQGFRIASLAEA